MKRLLTVAFAALLTLSLVPSAQAQSTDDASHDVSITVQEINAIEVGGNLEIVLDAVQPGEAPTPKTASSTYALTTNSTNARKITAALDGSYDGNIELAAELAAPSTGQSAGKKTLKQGQSEDLVTGIAPTSEKNLSITYTASASATDAPGTYTQTVTYTILAE
jgi:hypothetical protein